MITTSSRQTVETSRNVQTSTRTYNYTVTTSGNPSSSELFAFVSNHHDEVTTNGQAYQFPSTTTSTTSTARQIKPASIEPSTNHVSLQATAQKQPKPDPKPSVFKRMFTSSSKENFTQFQKESLRSHNEFRGKHGVADLKLSSDLCNFAQEWANVSHKFLLHIFRSKICWQELRNKCTIHFLTNYVSTKHLQ